MPHADVGIDDRRVAAKTQLTHGHVAQEQIPFAVTRKPYKPRSATDGQLAFAACSAAWIYPKTYAIPTRPGSGPDMPGT